MQFHSSFNMPPTTSSGVNQHTSSPDGHTGSKSHPPAFQKTFSQHSDGTQIWEFSNGDKHFVFNDGRQIFECPGQGLRTVVASDGFYNRYRNCLLIEFGYTNRLPVIVERNQHGQMSMISINGGKSPYLKRQFGETFRMYNADGNPANDFGSVRILQTGVIIFHSTESNSRIENDIKNDTILVVHSNGSALVFMADGTVIRKNGIHKEIERSGCKIFLKRELMRNIIYPNGAQCRFHYDRTSNLTGIDFSGISLIPHFGDHTFWRRDKNASAGWNVSCESPWSSTFNWNGKIIVNRTGAIVFKYTDPGSKSISQSVLKANGNLSAALKH